MLTHGHQDHVGGLPYLLRTSSAPIYGTAPTIGMAQRQLEEAHVLQNATLERIDDTQTLHLGPFRISPFAVAHSIPAAVGLVIDTPVGAIRSYGRLQIG